MGRFKTLQVGAKNTLDYRVYLEDEVGKTVSPFHDVPLYCEGDDNGYVHMVVEVPRHSQAKLEISKEEPMNPIKQDVKKGALRYVKNVFPYHGYIWNYGALPQTWESPDEKDSRTGLPGDNDPIDVIEIGSDKLAQIGEVRRVKVLGSLAMLDEGETDWKILAIDSEDSLAPLLNDAFDIEVHCPGLLDATRRWFRLYKVPDGKGANSFAFDGEVIGRSDTLEIISHVHASWKSLFSTATSHGISIVSQFSNDAIQISPTDDEIVDCKEPFDVVSKVFYPEVMLSNN